MKILLPFICLLLTLSCEGLGPQGPQGPQGEPGHTPVITMETTDLSDTTGYEIRFLADGNPISGWLPVDHGERGARGPAGLQRPAGQKGDKGDPGESFPLEFFATIRRINDSTFQILVLDSIPGSEPDSIVAMDDWSTIIKIDYDYTGRPADHFEAKLGGWPLKMLPGLDRSFEFSLADVKNPPGIYPVRIRTWEKPEGDLSVYAESSNPKYTNGKPFWIKLYSWYLPKKE